MIEETITEMFEESELIVIQVDNEEEQSQTYRWTRQNTLLLLETYRKYKEKIQTGQIKLKKLFEIIAKEITEVTGTNVTPANCENRWKVLERSYKKFVDTTNKTGRGRQHFEYATHMEEILGHKRNIHPILLLSSTTVDNSLQMQTGNEQNREVTESQNETLAIKKASAPPLSSDRPKERPYKNRTNKYNILKEIRNDRREFYRQRLAVENANLVEKRKKTKLLHKEYNYKKAGKSAVLMLNQII